MPPLIGVSLLGPPVVRIDGESPPPELAWRKHLATALVLWTERPQAVSRDRLLALLWADRPEAAARHSLNEALRVIRRACGGDAIVSTSTTATWVAPVELDTDAWSRVATDDPVAAAGLVRGEWCEGFAVPGASGFDDWLAAERDRWRGRLVECLVRAAAEVSDAGDIAAAITLAERARTIHPWSDDAATAVIRARWLAGDRAGALAAGQDHQRRLHEELGSAAGPAVVALLTRLRAGEMPDSVSSPRVPPPGPVGSPPPPLLHRSVQLAQALASLTAARATGTAATVVWLGPSGSGRSRVLDESCARLRLDGVAIARVHAVPGDEMTRDAGLDALADAMLMTLPGLGGGDPAAIATLAARRPGWRERFPAQNAAEDLPYGAALLSEFRAAADEGPVAIAIDDLDRFHPEALQEVIALVRALATHPVGFLFTVSAERDTPSATALCRIVGRELPGVVLTLPPLDAALAGELVAWGVPQWTPDAQQRLVRRLLAEAAGSTFIAVALLEALRNGLTLPERDVTWPVQDRTFDATFPGDRPTVLTVALRHAFHQFNPLQQRLLQRVAAGPEPCPERVLATACSADSEPVPVLDELERVRWLASDQRGYYIPAAAIRQFLLEDTLTPGQLRRLRGGEGDA